MHTLARRPVREAFRNTPRTSRAFTLIELLTVIAIIGILAAIAFGMMGGVKRRAAEGQAKTELAVIAQALDAYRLQFGDFPQTEDAAAMLQSLVGKRGPTGGSVTQRNLLDLSKFTFNTVGDPLTDASLTIVDPWGNPYQYYYYTVGTPITRRGYVLFSAGADGSFIAPVTTGNDSGNIRPDEADNQDNLYANK